MLACSLALRVTPALSQNTAFNQSEVNRETGQELEEEKNSSIETSNFIGNIITLKLHRKDCPYASIMAFAKRKYFSSLTTGTSEGMQPCRFCLPRYEMRVHCNIVNGAEHLYSNTQSETP
ncbi:MAG: hypothetical protein K2Y32_22245 [Candidatus Obscuribacterales bacterium]|nr:hypothetical protein [Candidatus Obscuribacterales bacterium]